jgi:hypothetical protein
MAAAPALDYAGVRRAERLWHEHMRGVPWSGPHATALKILHGGFKWTGIPDLVPLDRATLAPVKEGLMWNARSWLHKDGPLPESGWMRSYDINGMYLSAADVELGSGQPELREWPELDSIAKLPGVVQVSTLEGAPWSIASRWVEGMWMPLPLAVYLAESGAEFLTPRALVWPDHRRWLGPHVNLFRNARLTLGALDDPAAAATLRAVKAVYTRLFGGLIHSDKHNPGATNRPDWFWTVFATGQARMFRALADATAPVVGFHADAVWFLVDDQDAAPGGITISGQLGKFKAAGGAAWDRAARDAHEAGNHAALKTRFSL